MAEDALVIDEGASGGLEIEDLDAAVSIEEKLGVVAGKSLVIDDDIVVLGTADRDAVGEGDDDFLSVFKNEGEFWHEV